MKIRILLTSFILWCSVSLGQVPYLLGVGPIIHFEDTSTTKYILIDTSVTTNIWQIGHPGKTLFDSAYSATDAIVTDTLLNYPINNLSSFTMTLLRSQGYMDIMFFHKFNTDTLFDGGTIEISLDNGMTWGNVIDSSFLSQYQMETMMGVSFNFYSPGDSIRSLNNQPGFSGNSNGWIFSSFGIFYQDSNFDLDTFLLRFVFASDSLENHKEGWMIDDLVPAANHTGFEEHVKDKVIIFPNPFAEEFTVRTLQHLNAEVALYDLTSRRVLKQQFTGAVTLRTTDLAKGLYIYEVRNQYGLFAKGKVIKN
jgi:Secretion system C-terminal sorting domain